jgi:hypothetical protein
MDRHCKFCGAAAELLFDEPKERAYTCPECGAGERIFKSAQAWWYDGWRAIDGRHIPA